MARLLLQFTYEELGQGKATVEQLHQGLAGFAAEQAVRLFSTLNALLRDPTDLINRKAHNALVNWLFPQDVVPKILQSGRFALHRQQLLYMMKAAVVSCQGTQRAWTKGDYERVGLLCLMGSDLLPTIPDKASSTDLQRFIRFILHFAQIGEAAVHHPEYNITRTYVMLTRSIEKLRSSTSFVDVRDTFERTQGITIEVYFALMLGVLMRFGKFDENAFTKDPNSYALSVGWFAETSIDKGLIAHLLTEISASLTQFMAEVRKEAGPSDFTAFRDRPLVRHEESFYPVDFEFLATKTEAHVYWKGLRSLPVERQNDFQSFWGKLFEQYMADLIASSAVSKLNEVFAFVKYANDDAKELCDVIVKCGDKAVLIECKGAMFRGDAKYKGNVDLLEREILKKFVDDKGTPVGVGQLVRAVEAIADNRDCASGLTLKGVATIFPLLVTRDEIGSVVGMNAYLEAQFRMRLTGRKTMPFAVTPLICTSAEGLERWCSYLSKARLTDILSAHLKASKNNTDPLLRLVPLLPPIAVGNAVIESIGNREAFLRKDWKKLMATAAERLGLK